MWPKYWERFTIRNKQGISRGDGQMFEELVKNLLHAKYGLKWTQTPKSHDDNRDFWILLKDERIWAECKNYQDKIAMDILAPTLVMAQIYDVNTILFFSRSAINKHAKNKILAFGKKAEKQIYFYDGETLEELIWCYRNQLPLQYRPPETCAPTSKQNFPVALYFSQEAIAGVFETDERFLDISSTEHVRYNEVFGLSFFVSNPLPESSLHIKVAFSDEPSDRFCFQYIKCSVTPERALWYEQELYGGEGCAIPLNMRPIIFKPWLRLPGFIITGDSPSGAHFQWTAKPVKVMCHWVGQTKVIGHQYEYILQETENELVQNGKLSILLLGGTSGTGKTRMLTECMGVYLKYGYSILSLTEATDFSSAYFFKEIVSFLYEIPSAQIINRLEQKMRSNEQSKEQSDASPHIALQILRSIDKLQTEDELVHFIDDYGELLFEKLSSQRCVIAVDNVQFAGTAFLHFLRKYTLYSVNRNRINRSALLCVFNQDYMTAQVSELLFDIMHTNVRHIKSYKLVGFGDKELGLLFLRELIRVSDSRFDMLFEEIMDRISLNPYHLFQTVRYLEEHGVIKATPKNQGYILSDDQAWKAINTISNGITEVLERRWHFIVQQISANKLIHICSVLFLFEKIDSTIQKSFDINSEDLVYLQQRSFLRSPTPGIYIFDHDIIRAFFISNYCDQRLVCLEWLEHHGRADRIRGYLYIYDLYQLSVAHDETCIYEILMQPNRHLPSSRLASVFYQLLVERCLCMELRFQNKAIWIERLHYICSQIRSIDGSILAANYYEQCYSEIRKRIAEDAYTRYICAYRSFLHSYCDILLQLHNLEAAEQLIQSVLHESDLAVCDDPICTDELNTLRAIMYNRWYVSFNSAFPTVAIRAKRTRLMKESRNLISQIKNPGLKKLITYLNDSDEGYNYYGYRDEKDCLLSIWHTCLEGMPEAVPEKTMNYYRKRIQCDLISHDFEKTLSDITAGREYLEVGTFSHEPLIFNTFFLMAEISAYLQQCPVRWADYVERLLNELTQIYLLLGNEKKGDILLLRGINAFYRKDIDETYYAFCNAYKQYCEKRASRYWVKIQLLLENINVTFTALNIYSKGYNVHFLPEPYRAPLPEEAFNSYKASSVLRTNDKRINLPLI